MQFVSCCFCGVIVVFDFGVGEEDFVCWISLICCAGVGIDVEFELVFRMFGFLTMFDLVILGLSGPHVKLNTGGRATGLDAVCKLLFWWVCCGV
jgi:hypothetical protein